MTPEELMEKVTQILDEHRDGPRLNASTEFLARAAIRVCMEAAAGECRLLQDYDPDSYVEPPSYESALTAVEAAIRALSTHQTEE